jgi:lipoate-protein ligase A
MEMLDLTLPTVAENLALDEALLDELECQESHAEVLRLWEADCPAVVVGRSSRVHDELDAEYCQRRELPVLRRTSGGGAVVVGPGCLMYALVLDLERRPELRSVDQAHRYVLKTMQAGLNRLGVAAQFCGTSDLACGASLRKISGNSLRLRQRALLYHGTLLYDADLELIERALRHPPRQPDYRRQRPHRQFLANLQIPAGDLRQALVAAWQPSGCRWHWPAHRVGQLVCERYSRPQWNLGR